MGLPSSESRTVNCEPFSFAKPYSGQITAATQRAAAGGVSSIGLVTRGTSEVNPFGMPLVIGVVAFRFVSGQRRCALFTEML